MNFEDTEKDWQYDLSDLSPDNTLGLYMKEAARVPLLTKTQEQNLAMQMERGQEAAEKLANESVSEAEEKSLKAKVAKGQKARRHLIKANTRLVMNIVKRYSGRGVPLPDLIQGGNVALMRAVDKFDYRRGYKFSTYATWWIRQGVTRTLANQRRTIRIPLYINDQIASLRALSSQLEKAWGRKPTAAELAQELEIDTDRARFLLQTGNPSMSLDMPVGKEEDARLEDFVENPEATNPPDEAAKTLLQEKIQDLLLTLSPREAQILRYRFGLYGGRPHTLQEVGEKFNLTRERIRQLERMALRKLRHPARAREIKEYWV